MREQRESSKRGLARSRTTTAHASHATPANTTTAVTPAPHAAAGQEQQTPEAAARTVTVNESSAFEAAVLLRAYATGLPVDQTGWTAADARRLAAELDGMTWR